MHHPIIELDDVSFSYGDEVVLRRVALRIPEGAFIGVVGPSGAGKTTFLKLLAGTLKPTTGEVRYGSDGPTKPARMAVVPQLETIDWNFPGTGEEVGLLRPAADGPLLPWP